MAQTDKMQARDKLLIYQSIQSTNQPSINQSTNQSTYQPINLLSTNQPINQTNPIDQQINVQSINQINQFERSSPCRGPKSEISDGGKCEVPTSK